MRVITMFLWNNFTNDARVTREASSLSEAGYQVTVIAKREQHEIMLKNKEMIRKGIHVIRCNKPVLNFNKKIIGQSDNHLISNKKLYSLINKHVPNALLMMKMIKTGYSIQTDIYHSHDLNTLIQGVVCSKIRLKRRKLVFDSHEVNTSRTDYSIKLTAMIESLLLKFVDQVIVENETRAEYHELLYGERPLSIHNYSEYYEIDQVHLSEKLFPYKNEKLFIYQGGLQAGRGLELLIEAFHEAEVHARLLLIGDGKLKTTLQKKVEEMESNKIIFVDKVPYEELRQYTKQAYSGFQILQNTNFNHYSASSNKLYEYMMANVPVIATNLPEIKRVVLEEQGGIVIEESNKKQLTDAIKLMAESEDLRNKWSENMKKAKHKYNWNIEQLKLIKLYQHL